MAQKYKMTGCAKFFIFFILAAPLSYIGASYYNGSDPFEKLKQIEIFNTSDKDINTDTKHIESTPLETNTLKKELDLRNEEIKYLKQKINKLEEIIKSQKEKLAK